MLNSLGSPIDVSDNLNSFKESYVGSRVQGLEFSVSGLNSSKGAIWGIIWGGIMGLIKWDTRSLDYSSNSLRNGIHDSLASRTAHLLQVACSLNLTCYPSYLQPYSSYRFISRYNSRNLGAWSYR